MLTVVSTVWFALVVNVLSAALSVAAIVLYAVGYTILLKRRTSQNIVWGGLAGCMPTLIGWSAVTGTVQWPAVILFLLIFFWTPPHYWPLSMAFRDDYSAAGVPMLPVEQGPVAVGRQIVLYSWVMVATSLVLVPVASMGWVYAVTAVLAGGLFLARGAPPAPRREGRGGRPGAEADAPLPLLDHLRDGGLPRGGGRPAAPRRHRLSRQVAEPAVGAEQRGRTRMQCGGRPSRRSSRAPRGACRASRRPGRRAAWCRS